MSTERLQSESDWEEP